MFIHVGENIYAKDSIASVKVKDKTAIVIYPKNPTYAGECDTFGFNNHAEVMEEMSRIYKELQGKA